MANIDLDILMPERDSISFTGYKDKKRYEIDLFIPSVFFSIMSNKELNTEEQQSKMIEAFLKRKYRHIDIDWINENLSAEVQNYIATKILNQASKDRDLVGTGE